MQKFLNALILAAGFTLAFSFNAAIAAEEPEQLPLSALISSQYQCDLGDQLTVYRNAVDESYVKLRWQAKVYRLNRQMTTTGAQRYESSSDGLVLISIPDKSMLFDSKKGRQLANECRNHEQRSRYLSTPR